MSAYSTTLSLAAGVAGFIVCDKLRKPHDAKMNLLVGVITTVATALFLSIQENYGNLLAWIVGASVGGAGFAIVGGANPTNPAHFKFIIISSCVLGLDAAHWAGKERIENLWYYVMGAIFSPRNMIIASTLIGAISATAIAVVGCAKR